MEKTGFSRFTHVGATLRCLLLLAAAIDFDIICALTTMLHSSRPPIPVDMLPRIVRTRILARAALPARVAPVLPWSPCRTRVSSPLPAARERHHTPPARPARVEP